MKGTIWGRRNNTNGNKSVTQTVLNNEGTKCIQSTASPLEEAGLLGTVTLGNARFYLALGASALLV
jgi:hypothetical protein